MTPAELIAAFDVLADAPDGVKRLRELVLSLAVRGKLVEQDPAEEPASEATSVKRRGVAERARSKGPGAGATAGGGPHPFDTANDLPPGWCRSSLDTLGTVGPRNKAPDSAVVGFLPMANLPTDLRATPQVDTRVWSDVKKGYTHVADGDVVIAKITPCFQNGKGCVVSGLPSGIGAGTTELHVLRPNLAVVLPNYLLIFLRTPDFVAGGVATFTGTAGQQRVSTDYFRGVSVPLPPLAEQHRIVARVDELMALLDQLEAARTARDEVRRAARDAALAALRDAPDAEAVEVAWGRVSDAMDELFVEPEDVEPLRQAVLGLAVRGRLVPTLPGAGLTAGPCPIPTGWAWKRLLDLTTMITSGSRNWNQFYSATGATFIRSQDIKYDRLEYDDRAYVAVPGGSEGTRTRVDQGDWLITITGANVGKCALLREHPGEAYVSQHVALLRPKNLDFGRFGHIWLTAEQGGRGVLLADSYGAKPGLNLHQLRSLPVPVPPPDERDRIVAKVDALMAICDALAARLTAAHDLHRQFAAAAVHHLDV
jgi:type I restriction enzyme S subunit